jgi:deoxycytidylate deaminase
MAIAALVSTRSHDPDTKHGAVVVDHHHRILGIGYNGFPRGGDTSGYSTRRPDKYPMIVHAECNAILNCTTRPEGGKLYVTGCPCPRCMQMIIQSGIIAVNYGTRASVMVGDDEKGGVNLLAKNHGVKLMAWIAGCVSVLDSAIAIEVGE